MSFESDLGWRLLTPEDREREYSPSSCVGGNIEPYLTEYERASDAARAWCASHGLELRTLPYGPALTQSVDIVTPDTPNAPLLVFIHGGYWQQLSKVESFSPAVDFLRRGIAYAAVDYTLAPDATLDQIVAECRAALMMIRSNAAQLSIDPDRIFIAGSSAGGHLTATTSLDPANDWRPAGMVLLSGVYELEPLIGTSINDAVGLDTTSAHRNSPSRYELTGVPPAIVTWGQNETDQFKQQSRLFAAQLSAAGGTTIELEVPVRNHFDILSDLGADTLLGNQVAQLILPTEETHG